MIFRQAIGDRVEAEGWEVSVESLEVGEAAMVVIGVEEGNVEAGVAKELC